MSYFLTLRLRSPSFQVIEGFTPLLYKPPFRVIHRLIFKWLKGAVERGNSLRIVRVVFCRIKLYSVYPTNLLLTV